MIPVRISSATRPPRTTNSSRFISLDHPLAAEPCPVCDQPLGGCDIHLIVVGARVEDRGDKAWFTGAAVAVHDTCALPGEVVS